MALSSAIITVPQILRPLPSPCPVVNEAAPVHSYTIASATSSGLPNRQRNSHRIGKDGSRPELAALIWHTIRSDRTPVVRP
jgi:hypothetical protein